MMELHHDCCLVTNRDLFRTMTEGNSLIQKVLYKLLARKRERVKL